MKNNVMTKQRTFIMGVAIIWVAWFHTDIFTGNNVIDFFRQIGYGGVDIFFFLTGVGAFFSLQKCPDALSYMKRRMKRILPSYYPFIAGWLIMVGLTGELYGLEIIGNLSMLGWWRNGRNQFNWYVSAIWLFYLLAPVLVPAVARAKHRLLTAGILIFTGFAVSITFFHTQLLIAFSRIPVFILGILFGYYLKEENESRSNTFATERDEIVTGVKLPSEFQNYPVTVVLNICMLIGFGTLYFFLEYMSGYMWNFGLWWYPFFLIVPGLSMDLGLLADCMEKNRVSFFVKVLVEEVGKASFEIFLIHIAIFEYVKAHYTLGAYGWLVLYVAAMVTGVAYCKIINCAKDRRIRCYKRHIKEL